jgi:hypothetical protein
MLACARLQSWEWPELSFSPMARTALSGMTVSRVCINRGRRCSV